MTGFSLSCDIFHYTELDIVDLHLSAELVGITEHIYYLLTGKWFDLEFLQILKCMNCPFHELFLVLWLKVMYLY